MDKWMKLFDDLSPDLRAEYLNECGGVFDHKSFPTWLLLKLARKVLIEGVSQ